MEDNIQTIIAIYNAVKYNLPLMKRAVTITGYCLDKQVNINLKIGTNIEEILNNVCMIKHKYQKINLIAGGPMTGKSILSTNLIVTKTLNSVIINPCLENETKCLPCIGCGKCAEVCPVKLTPTEIIKYYNKKDINQLKSLKADYCIRCGLCSYICPSRIELTINTSKASDFVKRGINDK